MRRTGIRTGFKGASAPWPPGMVVGGEVCYDMWIWCVARWQRRCGSPRAASGPLCASRGPPAMAAAGLLAPWARPAAAARPLRSLAPRPRAFLVWGRGRAGPRGVPPLRGRLGAPAPRPPKDGRNDRFVSLTGREGVCGRPRRGLLHHSKHEVFRTFKVLKTCPACRKEVFDRLAHPAVEPDGALWRRKSSRDLGRREGRVCAGDPGRVSCTVRIISFQNVLNVLKTCSDCRKDFFDSRRGRPAGGPSFLRSQPPRPAKRRRRT